MPIKITKIELQKKNKKRYSLFADDDFIIGVSEQTLLAFDLYQGKELSGPTIEEIKLNENIVSVREQAWRFLSRREHSQIELRDKLVQKAFDKDIVDQVLSNLIKKDYLNDQRYARLVINDEINLKRSGPLLIKNKLLKKGIHINLVNDLLEELYHEDLQFNNCSELAEKKLRLLNNLDPLPQKKRLISFLTQKGYSWDIIGKVI
jgi:regulatory protein